MLTFKLTIAASQLAHLPILPVLLPISYMQHYLPWFLLALAGGDLSPFTWPQ
jgi:hypothetical protein